MREKNIVSMLTIFAAALTLMGAASAGTINIFGLDHTSLGNATLHALDGTLVVSNIGATGADGVTVSLPPGVTLWRPEINPLASPALTPDGSFLQLTTFGTLSGIPNQIVATARATDIGSTVALGFDLSRVSAGGLLAEYFLGGSLVATETIPHGVGGAGPVWLAAAFPLTLHGTQHGPPEFPIGVIDIGFDWRRRGGQEAVNLTTPSGQTFLIDNIDISTTSLGPAFGGYSSMSVTGSGISSFTVVNEQLDTVVPEPSGLYLFGSGLTSLAGLIWRIRRLKSIPLSY